MSWHNRTHAGQELAQRLVQYRRDPNAIVLGLPRGGVVVAFEVAAALALPLDIIVTRKIGAPDQPELAIGAVDENGVGIFNEELIHTLSIAQGYINHAVGEEKQEIVRRLHQYRADRPPLHLAGKTALVIDDGVATGFTMLAAIHSCRNKQAAQIVVAAPVIAPDTLEQLETVADEVVFLEAPELFMAVGQFYAEFEQVSDEAVIELLKKAGS